MERSSLLLVAVALAGDVLKVGSGQAFSTIQSAVDAASDGDVVLVSGPGTYPAFAADDKQLAIVGDGAGVPAVTGEIDVDHLSAWKLLVIARLDAYASSIVSQGLRIRDNAGAIRVQDCTVRGMSFGEAYFGTAGTGATFSFDDDIVLTMCNLHGGDGLGRDEGGTIDGGVGLFARSASLGLYGCSIRGGAGSYTDVWDGWDGGSGGYGLETPVGQTFATGCTFEGGLGGAGDYNNSAFCEDGGRGGSGGHGILVGSRTPSAATPGVQLQASSAQGGSGAPGGGSDCGFPGDPGQPGSPIRVNNGSAVTLPGELRMMEGPALARETASLPLTFHGRKDDVVYLDFQRGTLGPQRIPASGHLVRPVLRTMAVGTIPQSGTLTASFTVPELGPGVQSRTVLMTPVFVDLSGIEHAGNSFAVVLLDASL